MIGKTAWILVMWILSSTFAQTTGTPEGNKSTEAGAAKAQLPKKILKKMQKGAKKPETFAGEAMAWYLLQRTNGAPIDYDRYEEALSQMRTMDAARGGEGVGSWEALGPGNVGGRTRGFLIDPNQPNTLFAAGVAGGIWKSTDAGASWQPMSDFLENIAVVSLAFGYTSGGAVDSNLLYASTGEGYFSLDAVRGAGIFKSTDGGVNWVQLANTVNSNFHYVNRVITTPRNPNTVFAGTRAGVYRSTDGGANWTRVLANNGSGGTSGTLVASNTGIMDLVIRTDLGQDVLLASNSLDSTDGVYRSTDGGTTWSRVLTATGMGRVSLAIAPSNQAIMYAMASNRNNGDQLLNLYRSTDGGATWSPQIAGSFDRTNPSWLLLTNPVYANLDSCFSSPAQFLGQGWYDNVLAVAPHDPDVVFAGGIDLFRSDNGGASFGVISYWWLDSTAEEYAHADQHRILFHPNWNGTSNTTMFVGNDGGLHRTTNALAAVSSGALGGICYNGVTPTSVNWENLNNGYQVTQFYHGLPIPAGANNGDAYFGGCQDNGTRFGDDDQGPNAWVGLLGGDGGYVAFNPANHNVLFAETTNKSMQRSSDGGASFSSIVAGLGESSSNFPFIAPFRMDPNNPEIIWYGGHDPWRTSNAVTGSTVSWVSSSSASTSPILAWSIDPNSSNTVYFGNQSDQVFRSTNALSGSPTWTNITGTLPSSSFFISWIEVDPNNSNNVYVTNSSFNSSGHHVYKSSNGGSSWSDISNNLPDVPVHCLAVLPGDSNTLFIGTDLGVFVSTDGGASWAPNNEESLPHTVVESLSFVGSDFLYAFTHGRGVYRGSIGACLAVDISQGPTSQTTCVGGEVSFSVSATGDNPQYQWRKNQANLLNQTQASLLLTDVDAGDSGSYDCVVSNDCSTETSQAASLTVTTTTFETADLSMWRQVPTVPLCEDVNGNGLVDVVDFTSWINQTP